MLIDHPLVAAKLGVMRRRTTGAGEFRAALQELSIILLAEAARCWTTKEIEIETPLCGCAGVELERRVVLVPILRAGLGMLDGLLRLLPNAEVGHLGLYRDEKTLRPVTYYSRLPLDLDAAQVLLLDPMLATGHSASAAVTLLKKEGARHIQFLCVVSCPAGIAQLQGAHPDVPIVTAAIDQELNSVGYIVPGLGDAGDRYFGTR
ncbi:MAG: uracil phosphoribosyltransferase [Chthoniobacterales bacterium]